MRGFHLEPRSLSASVEAVGIEVLGEVSRACGKDVLWFDCTRLETMALYSTVPVILLSKAAALLPDQTEKSVFR